jgi:hypothetical protein
MTGFSLDWVWYYWARFNAHGDRPAQSSKGYRTLKAVAVKAEWNRAVVPLAGPECPQMVESTSDPKVQSIGSGACRSTKCFAKAKFGVVEARAIWFGRSRKRIQTSHQLSLMKRQQMIRILGLVVMFVS